MKPVFSLVFFCVIASFLAISGCTERITGEDISASLGLRNTDTTVASKLTFIVGDDQNGTLVTANINRDGAIWFERSHYYNSLIATSTSNFPDQNGIYWQVEKTENGTFITAGFQIERAGLEEVIQNYKNLSNTENSARIAKFGKDFHGA